MNIKLIITSRLSYNFCGSVALSILNSYDNPLVVDLDKLSKQEVIGLTRASKTGVIKAIEGEAELYAKAETFTTKKKEAPKEETIAEKIEEVIEEIKQPVVEVQPEPEVQEVVEVEDEVKVEEEVKETPKTTARKRTTTVKK